MTHIKQFNVPPRDKVIKSNIQRSEELLKIALNAGNTELVEYHHQQLKQLKFELKNLKKSN